MDLVDLDRAIAVLTYSANGEPKSQTISVEAEPCRFGGHRFYFRCPSNWRRCTVLACVNGTFASRQAQRLTYVSQSDDPLGRAYRARDKAEARALGQDGHPRPRGANRKRLVRRWIDREEAADALFTVTAMRRFDLVF
jgi:hypothetical protein